MYSRILIAVDDSRASKLAMQEAIKLAINQHARLRIIYVADEFIQAGEGVAVDFKKYEAAQRQHGEAILKKMLALTKKSNIQAEVNLIEISESNAAIPNTIIKAAKKWRSDLIVIGTHGRRGLSRIFKGSVAENIIKNTPVPVLIIRAKSTKNVKSSRM